MTPRPTVHRPDHPLAPPSGNVRVARMILYDKIGAGPHPCHWCGDELAWAVASGTGIVADHLNGDTQDNDPDNLVPSCRGCNANRSTHGRRQPKTCEHCGVAFIAKGNTHHSDRRFCSLSCSGFGRTKRPVTSAHGTRARYTSSDKCRCDECRAANSAYTRKLYAEGRLKPRRLTSD